MLMGISLVVVQDQHQPCPYLDDKIARMPLRLPVGLVTPEVTDELLEKGYRRSGDLVYRAQCPDCDQCKPTRVIVRKFRYSRSLKRVRRRGVRDLTFRWDIVRVDQQRVRLFNLHRQCRGLGSDRQPVGEELYRAFLADTCCQTRELGIFLNDRLVAVSIVDVGKTSTSAVYTYFDPAAGRYSLGTFAILEQIQWARQTGRQYVYLGMYVAENRHLNYKARFLPQQRLLGDQWVDFE